mgnify:FL=1
MNKFIPVCEPYLAGNELEYVTDAISTGWISSSGTYVNRFEEEFAKYCDCKYAVSVCNGTIALHLALLSLDIGIGDEVIIPSFTMIASAFAVCYTGAKPVFVDADKDTFNIDVTKIEKKITSRTKAIMPVHIFGKICNMDAIIALAKKYNLYIIEDAAEAHGATYRGKKAGSFSDVAAFSFFANKNITTGEGGMIITNNEDIAQKAKYFKNVCFPINGPRNYSHDDIGYNYRMSNVVAAIGLAQVEKADDYRAMRIRNNELYRKYLEGVPGIIFQSLPEEGCIDVCWMNTIVLDPEKFGHTKDETVTFLKSQNIDTRLLFKSMSRQKSLADFGCDCSGEYIVTDWLNENGFYLPSASNLDEETIKNICRVIKEFQK